MRGQAEAEDDQAAQAQGLPKAPETSLFSEMTAAFATAISGVGLAIALATLIFAGPIQDGLSRATTNFVLASAIVTLIIGLRGGFRPTIGVLQDGPTVVLIALAAGVAGSSAQNPALDTFVLIAMATLFTGIAMLIIGYVGAGDIVRFLPTTVISGFIAGTGWLLAKGGFDVMLDATLGLADLSTLLRPEVAKFWVPGAILGIVIQVLGAFRRVPSSALSLAVIAALVLFFAVVVAFSSVDAAEDANWFIGPFPEGAGVAPLSPSEFDDVDWDEVARQPGGVLAAIAVSLVAVLLNLSGLQSLTGDRLDSKRELKWAGIANVVISPLGAVAGFHALGDTALAHQMGARTKLVPVIVAVVSAAAALFGSQLIGMTPRIIAGGLLIAVGLALFISWTEAMRATSSKAERTLGLLIPVSIAAVGILEGITFGLVAACLIFVVRYSRIDPVRLEATARDLPSRVVRPAAEAEILSQTADRVVVIQLTGYQFFGSFTSVADRVRANAETADPPLSSVILDFRHVTGVDSSAFALLDQLAGDLAELDVVLLLSDLDPDLSANLVSGTPLLMEGLDFAIEYAENILLMADTPDPSATPFASLSSNLVERLRRRSIAAGDTLIEQGGSDAAMFFILAGDLIVLRTEDDGSLHRLRRVGSGTIVGENSLLSGAPRSAGIVAESEVEVLEITAEDYRRLRKDEPELALELQDHVLSELAKRSVSLSEHLARSLR